MTHWIGRKAGVGIAFRALPIFVLAACGHLAAGDMKTLIVPVPEGHDEVTYDASRIHLSELQQWLTLSPILSENNGLLVPQNVLSCDITDPRYKHCGNEWSIWLNAGNASATQERIRERLERLQTEQFPSDFSPIVDYFRAVQSFALWINQQEITFFDTRDVSLLESKYPTLNIDTKTACAKELDAIRKSSDEITEWKLVVFEWHNCVWKQFRARVGGYPQAAWDAALSARGIHEHLVVEE